MHLYFNSQSYMKSPLGISFYSEKQSAQKIKEIMHAAYSEELFVLLKRGVKTSEITKGLFDITLASIDRLWYFNKPMERLPSHEELVKSVKNINYKFVEFDDATFTVFIRNKGTKIE